MSSTDTGARILSVSMELFAEQGYEKTTVKNIAAKVGIRPSSIYYFYHSKEDILKTIFTEFEKTFAKHRVPHHGILQAAGTNALSDVLAMLFYTFGAEHARMMVLSRVIFSLQYENKQAEALYQKVLVDDSLDYIISVLKSLHHKGLIKEINFNTVAYIFNAFALQVFQDNLRLRSSMEEGNGPYLEGIAILCEGVARMIAA